jgi:hypothetical protein
MEEENARWMVLLNDIREAFLTGVSVDSDVSTHPFNEKIRELEAVQSPSEDARLELEVLRFRRDAIVKQNRIREVLRDVVAPKKPVPTASVPKRHVTHARAELRAVRVMRKSAAEAVIKHVSGATVANMNLDIIAHLNGIRDTCTDVLIPALRAELGYTTMSKVSASNALDEVIRATLREGETFTNAFVTALAFVNEDVRLVAIRPEWILYMQHCLAHRGQLPTVEDVIRKVPIVANLAENRRIWTAISQHAVMRAFFMQL